DIATRKDLEAALALRRGLAGAVILAYHRRHAPALVEGEDQSPRRRSLERWSCFVVEQADVAVGQHLGVVLQEEMGAAAQPEAARLATELPDDCAGRLVDLVHSRGVAGGDQDPV